MSRTQSPRGRGSSVVPCRERRRQHMCRDWGKASHLLTALARPRRRRGRHRPRRQRVGRVCSCPQGQGQAVPRGRAMRRQRARRRRRRPIQARKWRSCLWGTQRLDGGIVRRTCHFCVHVGVWEAVAWAADTLVPVRVPVPGPGPVLMRSLGM